MRQGIKRGGCALQQQETKPVCAVGVGAYSLLCPSTAKQHRSFISSRCSPNSVWKACSAAATRSELVAPAVANSPAETSTSAQARPLENHCHQTTMQERRGVE